MDVGRTAEELRVGDRASLSRTVSEADLALFAGATGDVNPIHFDQVYAEGTFFKGRIAHGILSAGFISAVIGNQLPGLSTIYVSQALRFLAPVRLGESVTAEVEVLEVDVERNRVRLRTTCATGDGTRVLDGEAVVMPPRRRPSAELAQAMALRSKETSHRLDAATEAFAAAYEGRGDEAGGSGAAAEGWSQAVAACHEDWARSLAAWARHGAWLQQESQAAMLQWLAVLGQAGRDYLRSWEGGGRGDPR